MNANAYMLRCTGCGARNRIPAEKIGQSAKCGRCGSPMATSELQIAQPIVVTDSTFESNVLKSALPLLLDCWAPWCGPCKMIGPVLEELAAAWKGKVRIAKLNVDENPATSTRYRIQSIPTLMVFDNGQLKDSRAGALPKQQIAQMVADYL